VDVYSYWKKDDEVEKAASNQRSRPNASASLHFFVEKLISTIARSSAASPNVPLVYSTIPEFNLSHIISLI
jgi:hypothetical protein